MYVCTHICMYICMYIFKPMYVRRTANLCKQTLNYQLCMNTVCMCVCFFSGAVDSATYFRNYDLEHVQQVDQVLQRLTPQDQPM